MAQPFRAWCFHIIWSLFEGSQLVFWVLPTRRWKELGRTWTPIQNQHILNQWFHKYPLELWKKTVGNSNLSEAWKKKTKSLLRVNLGRFSNLTSATIWFQHWGRHIWNLVASITSIRKKNTIQLCIFDHFGHDGSMGRTVYLPTLIVDLDGINVGKSTVRPMDASWVLDDLFTFLDVFSDTLTSCQLSRLASLDSPSLADLWKKNTSPKNQRGSQVTGGLEIPTPCEKHIQTLLLWQGPVILRVR